MDICSIVEFREALLNPEDYFLTLKHVVADLSTLSRTRHFAECRATINGRNAIIYAPISPQAMALAHTAIAALHNVDSRVITRLTLHSCELRHRLNATCSSVVVEWPPHGLPLRELLYTTSRDTLMSELGNMAHALISNNISHNHINLDNIIVDNLGRWHLIRQYYSSQKPSGDDKAIEMLRSTIAKEALTNIDTQAVCEALSSYNTQSRLVEHRRKIVDNDLVGFVDENDNIVIECQYLSATNFAEHRSVVTLPNLNMGLIDIDGNEIIPAIYNAVRYDIESGTSWVEFNSMVAQFDYEGKQISQWQSLFDVNVEI